MTRSSGSERSYEKDALEPHTAQFRVGMTLSAVATAGVPMYFEMVSSKHRAGGRGQRWVGGACASGE